MTLRMGPTATGIGPRGGRREGWGIQPVRMGGVGFGETLTIRQARMRIRRLKAAVRSRAKEMLHAAAEPLRDQWKDNIEARGWSGEGGITEGAFGKEMEFEALSSGRYYNSIQIEINDDLEVHVGSTIPRPSGRGLHTVSYPELLEFGWSDHEAMPTLRPALDQAGPEMERRSRVVFDALAEGILSGSMTR